MKLAWFISGPINGDSKSLKRPKNNECSITISKQHATITWFTHLYCSHYLLVPPYVYACVERTIVWMYLYMKSMLLSIQVCYRQIRRNTDALRFARFVNHTQLRSLYPHVDTDFVPLSLAWNKVWARFL